MPNMKSTEKPFASVDVHWGQRNGTFVPIAVIDPAPEWARELCGQYHGHHKVIAQDGDAVRCVLFWHKESRECSPHRVPPGDWLIYYSYNENDGTHDHVLCVASRLV